MGKAMSMAQHRHTSDYFDKLSLSFGFGNGFGSDFSKIIAFHDKIHIGTMHLFFIGVILVFLPDCKKWIKRSIILSSTLYYC